MPANDDFTLEQRNYLSGFFAGAEAARAARGLPTFAATLAGNGKFAGSQAAEPQASAKLPAPSRPEDLHCAAQNRFLEAGQKLSAEEEAKRAANPLDLWDTMEAHASEGRFPRGLDVFRFKYHGLFYVAPAQNAYMCRLRFPAGIISAHQMRGVAHIAEQFAGGYADVTTRANLQLREIAATSTTAVLNALVELGIVIRGSGADNLRNITAPATAGIDCEELFDVRPLARQMHHYILNHRELYGLPRKFNIAFDGGGSTSALEDTNDLGFAAVRVAEGKSISPGVYFRVQLGGITGHGDFARDAGLLLKPEQCVPVAAALVRVFIDHGDRTDRKKARLKYLLDAWGLEKYVAEAEKHLAFPLMRVPPAECEPRPAIKKHAHAGVHRQRQEGRSYVGVVLPVGRLQAEQMRRLAELAEQYGSGSLRLTVWQNLLLTDIRDEDLTAVQEELQGVGLDWQASSLRGALVACTGNAGCKFAAANTKRHALELIERLEKRLELDQPVNIHLTGCPHSCAQHYIGDLGLLATKVEVGDDLVEGYRVFVGGGYGAEQGIGREVFRGVPACELGDRVEGILRGYLEHRLDPGETFIEFVRRHSTNELSERFAGSLQTQEATG